MRATVLNKKRLRGVLLLAVAGAFSWAPIDAKWAPANSLIVDLIDPEIRKSEDAIDEWILTHSDQVKGNLLYEVEIQSWRKCKVYWRLSDRTRSEALILDAAAAERVFKKIVRGDGSQMQGELRLQVIRGDISHVKIKRLRISAVADWYLWGQDAATAGAVIFGFVGACLLLQAEKKGVSIFENNAPMIIIGMSLTGIIGTDLLMGYLFVPPISGYRSDLFHHGLKSNFNADQTWGDLTYRLKTNALGMKAAAPGEVDKIPTRKRVIFLGDSFVEGKGFPYEQTFVGKVADQLGQKNVEVLNAGVKSYSPRLYYLRMLDLLENKKIKCHELQVFVDISDIQDELIYQDVERIDRHWLSHLKHGWRDYGHQHSFLQQNWDKAFLPRRDQANLGYRAELDLRPPLLAESQFKKVYPEQKKTSHSIGNYNEIWESEGEYYVERSRWTCSPEILEKWGRLGVALAIQNMDRLYQLCEKHGIKMGVTVYPWPRQIINEEKNCLQVKIWKEFCEKRGINFINLFPDFIGENPALDVLKRCFIEGDVHWNAEGHEFVAARWLKQNPFKE